MTPEDRMRKYRDAIYATRSPREKSEQAAFKRYVIKKIEHLNEKVGWARDQYDAKSILYPKVFMKEYKDYQNEVTQFSKDLDKIIARIPSKTLLTKCSPVLERLEGIVDGMVQIIQNPKETPEFPEKKVIQDVASIGERLHSFKKHWPTAVHRKIPLSQIPWLRQEYEFGFRGIDLDVESIQADPGISQKRLGFFNGEKLYYQHMRTTFSNIIEKELNDGVQGDEPLKEKIFRFVGELGKIVAEIRRLSTGPDTPDLSSSDDTEMEPLEIEPLL